MTTLYTPDEQLFVNALIEKKDIKDCYTKAYILQKQGCDMFELFWRIFIDFYAHTNPKLEIFIMKKQMAWNERKNINSILYIIKNMFISNSSQNVYLLRKYITNGGLVKYIYKTKTPKTKYTNLAISIRRKHYENIAYELVRLVKGCADADADADAYINEIFDVIITHFTNYYGGSDKEKINEKWKNRPHIPKNNIAFYLLAMIIHLYEDEQNIAHSANFVIPRKEEVEFYSSLGGHSDNSCSNVPATAAATAE